jgi:serine/threonine protein kinase/Tfp pilus assembly protein PilF
MTIQQAPKFISKEGILGGKYRIIEPIGKGGMGVVYKAEDIKLERTVALKFLPAELTEDPEARERFVREAKAAAALSHPHICTIHEIGEEENQYFIAMECIEGQSLKQKIHKGPLDQVEALDIAIQVAEGLDEAHKKGIVHRDIKPGNIMVTDKGTAKVMDFGLAKVFGASLITKEAKTMGTVAYMSPEQAQGQSVDHHTDIWSLGVVLYEMLTGQLPFKGEYDQSIIHSILNKEPEPLTKALSTTPNALENVVLTALAKNPAARYQSMAELLEDLKAIAQGLKPIKAKHGLFRGRILGLRKPVFFTGIAALAASVVFVILTVIIPSAHTTVFNSVAILPIINETGDAEREYFANGLTRELNTELYKVAALTVPPAETILTYKNSDKPPKKIAQELKVKAVVQVSWLQVGSRHRLIYTLIDPFRNKVIATDRLEMEEENIIILQRELARAVVGALKVAVTPAEQALLAREQKVNPDAYYLYIRGYYAYRISYNFAEALDYFDRAINADPNLALAHAYKGLVYWDMGINGRMPEKEASPKARESLQKALDLDYYLAVAHSYMGWILCSMDWDFAGAERALIKALELEPGNYEVQLSYNIFLRVMGRYDEGIKRQAELQESLPAGFPDLLVSFYLWAGRLDEGVDLAEKAHQANPSTVNKYWLALAYQLKGMYAEALSLLSDLSGLPGFEDVPDHISLIYALSGKREEALSLLEKVKSGYAERNVDSSFYMAPIYAALGE